MAGFSPGGFLRESIFCLILQDITMKSVFSFFGRILSGLWGGLSAVRRFLSNLFFLTIIFLIAALFLFDSQEDVPDGAALILSPSGMIVEQKTETMLANELLLGDATREETLLKDIINVIDYAKDDDRILVMVLDLQNLGDAGISKLQEIGAAIERFKDSGKPVIAAADIYGQQQYYLAAHADRVYLHPMGAVIINGYGLFRNYYRSALEKLMVQLHVFVVGSYKSALEPFLRDDMSDYAREANSAWLTLLWKAYTADVSELRGLGAGSLDDFINHFPAHLAAVDGDTAKLALKNGLVDALKTRDEVRDELTDLVGLDEGGSDYKQIEFDAYLAAVRPELATQNQAQAKIGVIVGKGMILDGIQPAGKIGGDSLSEMVRLAREDDDVKAIVLRIDSGGGSALASDVIWRELQLTRLEGKPVVVSMGAVAASGGYWIATAADEIWATPTTLTGSIGIFGAFPTFEKSLDHLGIHSDGVGTTEMADAFNPARPLNPLVKQSLQMTIDNGYNVFISKVAEGRGMRSEAVEKIAQGRVYSGTTALNIGLVDKLGSLQDAIRSAAAKAGLDDYEIDYRSRLLTAREKLMRRLNRLIYTWIKNSNTEALHPVVRVRDSILNDVEKIIQFNDSSGIYAFCLPCAFESTPPRAMGRLNFRP